MSVVFYKIHDEMNIEYQYLNEKVPPIAFAKVKYLSDDFLPSKVTTKKLIDLLKAIGTEKVVEDKKYFVVPVLHIYSPSLPENFEVSSIEYHGDCKKKILKEVGEEGYKKWHEIYKKSRAIKFVLLVTGKVI